MPRLVILNAGPDTAGCGIGLKRAFDKYAEGWETRSVSRDTTYLDYPTDILWPYTEFGAVHSEVRQLVHDADVVHVMDSEAALYPFRKLLKGKRIVVHHLGTHFRRNPQRASARCRSFGAVEVTDSIDLIRPHVRFLPVPIDVEAMSNARKASQELAQVRSAETQGNVQDDGGQNRQLQAAAPKALRIAHAPTRREVKSTDTIIAVVERLAQRYPIEFDLIEGVSNRECLERKARADLFVDQLLYGFGMNAIECWAMGIPVVSGLVDQGAKERGKAMWGYLPWANATSVTLEDKMELLVADEIWRNTLGNAGYEHVQRWHSQEAVVRQTLAVYDGSAAEAVA